MSKREIPISEVPAEATTPWCAAVNDPKTGTAITQADVESITCAVSDGKSSDATYPVIADTVFDEFQSNWDEDNRGYNVKHFISFEAVGRTYLARLIIKLNSGSTVVVLRYFVTY